jgi:hypothetical protein
VEDFRVKTSWRTSRKRRRLKRLLGADGVLAIEDLWSYCAAERTTGDLSGLTDADIEDEVEWCGEGDLVPALVGCGLLDGESGSYQIHDWGEHNPYVATGNPRSEQAAKAAHARWHKGKPVSSCIYCTADAQAMLQQCSSNADAMLIPKTAMPISKTAMPLPTYLPTLQPTNDTIDAAPSATPSTPKEPTSPPVISIPLVDKTEYDIDAEQIAEWSESYPAVDVLQELRKAKEWAISNPTKKKTRRGIRKHLTGWLSGAQDKGGSGAAPRHTRPANVGYHPGSPASEFITGKVKL